MTSTFKRTPLFEKHIQLQARIVEFGGWEMPVQYTGIIEEHQNTRTHVGLFDISHMGEIEVTGKDALPFVQKIVTQNVLKSKEGSQVQYSMMCYENGSVVDDILIYKHSPTSFLLCVNASNTEKDYEWILSNINTEEVSVNNRSQDFVQLAIQGPKALPLLQKLTHIDLSKIKYYHFTTGKVLEDEMIISRTGYTGEDGFELYLSPEKSPKVWDILLDKGKEFNIKPCGLGARDTLRIEMCYPLYGHEISGEITPIESDLEWVVKWDKGNFVGRSALADLKEKGISRKLVAFELLEAGIPRQGYPLYSLQNELIGEVTSGTLSPTLKKGIGIGFIKQEFSSLKSKIQMRVRSKTMKAQIVQKPFIQKKEVS